MVAPLSTVSSPRLKWETKSSSLSLKARKTGFLASGHSSHGNFLCERAAVGSDIDRPFSGLLVCPRKTRYGIEGCAMFFLNDRPGALSDSAGLWRRIVVENAA